MEVSSLRIESEGDARCAAVVRNVTERRMNFSILKQHNHRGHGTAVTR